MSDIQMFLGQTLSDYEITDFLGEGAFSLVFAGKDTSSSTDVAIKILKLNANADQVQEFDNEGKLLVKLAGSDHVVDIFDSRIDQMNVVLQATGIPTTIDVHYHVLELADGCLDKLVAHLSSVPWPERLALYRDLVLGVHQMHSASIVHRDLKSGNCLLIAKQFNAILAKVSDLGRARDLNDNGVASLLHYRVGRGDPSFRPPEMLWRIGEDSAHVHRQADIYGLGSLLFELITGQGITSFALAPQFSSIQTDWGLPDDQRRIQYRSRLNEIRSWYEVAYLSAAPQIPRSIRFETLELLRQLCDPDPNARYPKSRVYERRLPTDLNWLLRRVDILIKRMETSEYQSRRIQARKEAK